MKKILLSTFGIMCLLAALPVSFQSCDSCEQEITYTKVTPIYKSYDEIRVPIENEASRPLKNPGKIYFYQNYIFINELSEGIHIIDNSNPASPQAIGFLKIVGNQNMAIRNNVLYADNYIDLLAIDISTVTQARLLHRSNSIFPYYWEDPEHGLAVDYKYELVTEKVSCNEGGVQVFGDVEFDGGGPINSNGGGVNQPNGGWGNNSSAAVPGGGNGIGGSMARFTIAKDRLYIIGNSNLQLYSLVNSAKPIFENEITVGWGIETIFPYKDYLFIGANNGMSIFDNSVPSSPRQVSVFQHARACDPVYVSGNRAYVTLRDGTECQGFVNQLDVIDITDVTNPSLLKTYPMQHPHGLSIKNNNLYLCEGQYGVKAFDISNDYDFKSLAKYGDFDAYDVIARPGAQDYLFVVGKDGFYQFLHKSDNRLELVSKIPVQK